MSKSKHDTSDSATIPSSGGGTEKPCSHKSEQLADKGSQKGLPLGWTAYLDSEKANVNFNYYNIETLNNLM